MIKVIEFAAAVILTILPASNASAQHSCCGKPAARPFVVYDAMHYPGKPDLTADGFSRIRLIYEAFLLDDNYEPSPQEISAQVQSAKKSGITAVSLDIEKWYETKTSEEIKNGLKGIYAEFKKEIPGCSVGNYGIPAVNYSAYRYLNTKPVEEFDKWFTEYNERLLAAGEVSDVLYPSVYIVTDDVDAWIEGIKVTSEFIRGKFPDKPVVAYIWPQYYDDRRNPLGEKFIDPERWGRILEAAYEYFDGVVIWAHGRDENDNKIPWSDQRVQAMYKVTKEFIARHGIISTNGNVKVNN